MFGLKRSDCVSDCIPNVPRNFRFFNIVIILAASAKAMENTLKDDINHKGFMKS